MKEKLIAALKNKYPNLGFSDKTMDNVGDYLSQTVTEEQGIEPAVNGAELLLKAFQGDIDRRVADAITKVKGEQKKPEPLTEKNQEHKPEEVPTWAKGLFDKLEAFERKEEQSRMVEQVKSRLADKVPESFYRGRTLHVETEADIDKLVTEIQSDFTAVKQDMINQGVFVEVPKKPQAPGQEGVELAKRIAEQRNKGMTEGVEGIKI